MSNVDHELIRLFEEHSFDDLTRELARQRTARGHAMQALQTLLVDNAADIKQAAEWASGASSILTTTSVASLPALPPPPPPIVPGSSWLAAARTVVNDTQIILGLPECGAAVLAGLANDAPASPAVAATAAAVAAAAAAATAAVMSADLSQSNVQLAATWIAREEFAHTCAGLPSARLSCAAFAAAVTRRPPQEALRAVAAALQTPNIELKPQPRPADRWLLGGEGAGVLAGPVGRLAPATTVRVKELLEMEEMVVDIIDKTSLEVLATCVDSLKIICASYGDFKTKVKQTICTAIDEKELELKKSVALPKPAAFPSGSFLAAVHESRILPVPAPSLAHDAALTALAAARAAAATLAAVVDSA